MKVKFKKFSPIARVPKKATPGLACYDVYSARDIRLAPGVTKTIALDIGLKFPKRYACRLYPRSSLSLLPTFVGGGVVHSDYHGNISVILTNFDSSDVNIKVGDRIAQIMFLKTEETSFEEVSDLGTQLGILEDLDQFFLVTSNKKNGTKPNNL